MAHAALDDEWVSDGPGREQAAGIHEPRLESLCGGLVRGHPGLGV